LSSSDDFTEREIYLDLKRLPAGALIKVAYDQAEIQGTAIKVIADKIAAVDANGKRRDAERLRIKHFDECMHGYEVATHCFTIMHHLSLCEAQKKDRVSVSLLELEILIGSVSVILKRFAAQQEQQRATFNALSTEAERRDWESAHRHEVESLQKEIQRVLHIGETLRKYHDEAT